MPETTIHLPSKLFKGAQPFSIDFGGSVIKVIHIDKEASDEERTTLRCNSFSRAEYPKALEFIKSKCSAPEVKEGEEAPEYHFTGVGVHEQSKTLEKAFGVRVATIWEGECSQAGLNVIMSHLPEEQLYLPTVAAEVDPDMVAKLMEMVTSFKGSHMPQQAAAVQDPDKKPEEDPIMLSTLGSAFVHTYMFPDGKMVNGQMNPRGGRMFLGLGSLLSGAKTFDELIALAAQGDDKTVNVYPSDLMKNAEGADDGTPYSKMKVDVNVFAFGWAIGKSIDDFSKADLIKALLVNMTNEVTKTIIMLLKQRMCRKVVNVGSFAQSELPRMMMENEFNLTMKLMPLMDPTFKCTPGLEMRTLKDGSHLVALGALLHSAQPQ